MIKHGLSRTRIYQCWCDMKTRCLSKGNPSYYLYGGRGITICKEWMNFITFYKWAMENGYSDDLTIDRIDNNKGYSPDNCKWSTQHEQSMNKRHKANKTGYVGVKKINKCKDFYTAEVCRFGVNHYVGHYKTAEEASIARDEYIRRNGL